MPGSFKIPRINQHFTQKKKTQKNNVIDDLLSSLWSLSSLLFSLAILLLLSVMYLIFRCYRQALWLILKVQIGEDFGGFVERGDAVFTLDEDTSRCYVNLLGITEFPDADKLYSTMYDFVDKNWFRVKHPNLFKLSSTMHEYCGYNYYVKNQYKVEECLKRIHFETATIDQSQLQATLSEYNMSKMPKDGTALWEILILDKPILWGKDKKKNQFAFVFRFHHCLGDGLAITQLLLQHFSDNGCVSYEKQWTNAVDKIKITFAMKLRYLCFYLWAIACSPIILINSLYLRPPDKNRLHGKPLSGEKLVCWSVEEEPLFISKIKAIRKKVPNTRFIEIVLTALSASLEELFAKNGGAPEFVSILLPQWLAIPKKGVCDLSNNFGGGIMTLPVGLRQGASMEERLEEVKFFAKIANDSPDFAANHWMLSTFPAVVPNYFLKLIRIHPACTLFASIIPATGKVSIFGGNPGIDMFGVVPHAGKIGVSFMFTTYDNRCQIALNVDKALISNYQESQNIVDGVFTQILKLEKEVFQLES